MHQRVLTPRNRTDGVMVGLLLFVLYFGNLLHRCGDVELNPGPPKQDFFRQTRLTSSSRANNAELNSLEGNSTSSGKMVGSYPNLKDIMHMLTTMNSKFDDIKNYMSDIKESYSSLKDEMHELRETITDLKEENKALKEENDAMRTRLENVENKTDDLESRSKRNNIIIHRIQRKEEETRQECEELVCEIKKLLSLTGYTV